MERKGRFVPVWGRYLDIFRELPKAQLGQLLLAMMDYYFDGVEPQLSAPLAMSWYFIKPDLDYAKSSYEKKVESGRKGGKRSAEVRRKKKQAEAKESNA